MKYPTTSQIWAARLTVPSTPFDINCPPIKLHAFVAVCVHLLLVWNSLERHTWCLLQSVPKQRCLKPTSLAWCKDITDQCGFILLHLLSVFFLQALTDSKHLSYCPLMRDDYQLMAVTCLFVQFCLAQIDTNFDIKVPLHEGYLVYDM